MNTVRKMIKRLFALLVVAGIAWTVVSYYSFIFSKKVVGVLVSVERIDLNVSLLQQNNNSGEAMDPKLFSFAVAIQNDAGEIMTSSAEDRQWAAAIKGKCAEAVYFPYPPWQVMKAGTYFGARLDRLFDCPEKAVKVLGAPPS